MVPLDARTLGGSSSSLDNPPVKGSYWAYTTLAPTSRSSNPACSSPSSPRISSNVVWSSAVEADEL